MTAGLDFRPREFPTFYSIGETTTRSSIMRVFPRWAEHLGIGGTPLVGIDCRLHDDPAVYRRIVEKGLISGRAFGEIARLTREALSRVRAELG